MIAGDLVREREALFLGSRLKRLAERMQADVVAVAEGAGLSIQPSQYPLLATLDRYGAQTISALTQAMQVSQPSVTRTVARLLDMGLITVSRAHRDQRHKTVALTAAGGAAMARSKALVWPRIETAVGEMTASLSGSLFEQIAAIETMLGERPLSQRGAARPALTIHDYRDDLAHHFRDINAEWIEAMYRMEATDHEVLDDPRGRIIDPGGAILFVEVAGQGIVGACALQQTGPGRFELTKMGVRAAARGSGAGAFLLAAMVERAKAMGAETLYLLTNRKSAAAIHLYEKAGFVHDPVIMADHGSRYARCDVAMRHPL